MRGAEHVGKTVPDRCDCIRKRSFNKYVQVAGGGGTGVGCRAKLSNSRVGPKETRQILGAVPERIEAAC